MPPTVFLACLRPDTSGAADRLRAHLAIRTAGGVAAEPGPAPFGVDPRAHADAALGASAVVLALLVPSWAERLQSPRDAVRLQLEAALQRGIPVLLVQPDGVPVPPGVALPSPLRPLADAEVLPFRTGAEEEADVQHLLAAVASTAPQEATPSSPPPIPRLAPQAVPFSQTRRAVPTVPWEDPSASTPAARRRAWLIGGTAAVLVAALLLTGLYLRYEEQRPVADTNPDLSEGITALQHQRYADAYAYFNRSVAHDESGTALYYMGLIRLQEAEGAGYDPQQARTLLRRAAEQGNPEARMVLAGLLTGYQDVPPDYPEALHWLEVAADADDARAAFRLGELYEDGWDGTPPDLTEAARWYRRARRLNHLHAGEALHRVEHHSGEGHAHED